MDSWAFGGYLNFEGKLSLDMSDKLGDIVDMGNVNREKVYVSTWQN